MRTSLYNIEARVGKNGKPYIMELSPRAGGNRLSEILRMATSQDIVTACIKAAVGEPVSITEATFNGFWADVILHTPLSGKLVGIELSDAIKPFVKEMALYKQIGQQVDGFKAANEALGSLFLRFDTRAQMEQIITNIEKFVNINIA